MANETVDDNTPIVEVPESDIDTGELQFTSVDEMEAQIKKDVAIKKQLYARAKKAEDLNKTSKENTKVAPTSSAAPDSERFDRLELKTDGYSSLEIDFIMKNGGIAATNDEFVQEAIASRRAKAKSESAAPEGSPKSPIFKKYTKDELSRMPLDKLAQIIPRGE